ncbi:hypothetical protein EGW08_014130, partial [Elysia chlorotica]
MGKLQQLGLLLWKNYKLKIRSPWMLLLETAIPLVMMAILMGIRSKIATDKKDKVIASKPVYLWYIQTIWQDTLMLGFTPNTEATQRVMDTVLKKINQKSTAPNEVFGYDTEQDALDHIRATESPFLSGVVVFSSPHEAIQGANLPKQVKFVIRPLPKISLRKSSYKGVNISPQLLVPARLDGCGAGESVHLLQFLLAQSITEYWATQLGKAPDKLTWLPFIQCMSYIKRMEAIKFAQHFADITAMSFFFSVIFFTKQIVDERTL